MSRTMAIPPVHPALLGIVTRGLRSKVKYVGVRAAEKQRDRERKREEADDVRTLRDSVCVLMALADYGALDVHSHVCAATTAAAIQG